ncbi:MAG: hypothetical protein GYA65_17405, partial [Actinobacteria bacterium]|nr:hypothetical protein [Actinomycetota bacterium]
MASELHGADAVSALTASLQPAFDRVGARLVASVEAANTSLPMAVLVLTGGTERAVLAAWSARQQFLPGEPLLLLTHAGHNSLPAALEALARLQRDGANGRIVMV